MKRPLVTGKRLLLVVVVLLLVSCILPDRMAAAIAWGPQELVEFLLAPVTQRLHRLSVGVSSGNPAVPDLGSEQDWAGQYADARVYINQLESELSEVKNRFAQYRQVEQIIGEAVRQEPARVTSSYGTGGKPMLAIDRGMRVGVTKGLAVVSGLRVVGEVVSAGPFNAHVQLITSHDLELRVRIAPPTPPVSPREFVEYVKFDKDRSSFVVNVAQGKPVQVGDWAFLSEDKWLREARGFLVGQVECISDDPDDPHNYKHVIIRPLIREDSLWAVTVLVSN